MGIQYDPILKKLKSNKFKTLQHDTAYTPTGLEPVGTTYWDSAYDTVSLVTNGNTYQLGQELAPLYKNESGEIIYDGAPVAYAGGVGASGRLKIVKAIADGTYPVDYNIGVATMDIGNNEWGKVTSFGGVRNFVMANVVETGITLAKDDIIYVSATEAGKITNVKPDAPNQVITIGVVASISGANASIAVRPTWTQSITDSSDVNGTPLDTNGQMMYWNNDNGYFDFSTSDGVIYDFNNKRFGVGMVPNYRLQVADSDGCPFLTADETQSYVKIGCTETEAPIRTLDVGGNQNFDNVLEPTSTESASFTATLAGQGAGNLSNGLYYYAIVYVTADGGQTGVYSQTYFASVTVVDNSTDGQVNLTGIPVSPDPRVISRDIYRTTAGGNYLTSNRKIATLNDNTTTTYLDNIADASQNLNTLLYRKANTTASIFSLNGTAFAQATDEFHTAFGKGALDSYTIAHSCSAFGGFALTALTSGNNNNAFGLNASGTLTTGGDNDVMGSNANYGNNGSGNCVMGLNTLRNSDGVVNSNNVALGKNASLNMPTGSNYNTTVGYLTGRNFGGTYNVLIGAETGYLASSITVGNYNIMIGPDVGDNATAGADKNILIGNQLDLQVSNGDGQLSIGNLIFGTGLDGTGTTVSSGNIGIGEPDPSQKVHITSSDATTRLRLENNNATVNAGVEMYTGSTFIGGFLGSSTITSFYGPAGLNAVLEMSSNDNIEFQKGSNGTRLLLYRSDNDTWGLNTGGSSSEKWSVGGNIHLFNDNNKIIFGTGKDASMFYDGTDMKIVTDDVAASDLIVDCGTDKTVELAETVWKDINLGGISLRQGAIAPDPINLDTTNIQVYAFDGATLTETASGSFELQHDYKEGTNIIPHIHWYPTTANSGNVKWQLEYYIREDNTVKLTGTLTVTDSADGTAWEELRADFAAITGTTLKIGAQIHFRIFRDPTDVADTYGDDAAIATIGIHYEVDTIGSRQITTK